MGDELQDGFALEESALFGEGVEHFRSRMIGRGIADLIAIGNGDWHTSIFLLLDQRIPTA